MSFLQSAAFVLALLALANHEDRATRLLFTVAAMLVMLVLALRELT